MAKLRRRHDRGEFLTAFAHGEEWQPLAVPIRGPDAAAIAADFARAQEWARRWATARPRAMRVEYREVGGRRIGTNTIPAQAWIDSYDDLWAVLGVRAAVGRFAALLAETRRRAPVLAEWMAAHPMRVLKVADDWTPLAETALWIERNGQPGLYLRQVDVPRVDTKFIESHRALLTDLLDVLLPPDRIDEAVPRGDFVGRYGFRRKPEYVRVRALDPTHSPFGPYSEVSARVADLAATSLDVATVFVIENEVSYLAFPPVPNAVAIWGAGYAVDRLAPLRWLSARAVVYWGDIDTHGFAILDRLRHTFPTVRSMLMDRPTLLAHPTQWVHEDAPTRVPLSRLDLDELALYQALTTDEFGPAVRLEQGRVRFSLVTAAALASVGVAPDVRSAGQAPTAV